jgi:glycerophosphoryl diester phosphodiesterase
MLAYTGAINGGADYIDCPVQITSDGVPICREFANLLKSTNVATNHALLQNFLSSYPGFDNGTQGVFTFDIPWADLSTLRGKRSQPLSHNPFDEGFFFNYYYIIISSFPPSSDDQNLARRKRRTKYAQLNCGLSFQLPFIAPWRQRYYAIMEMIMLRAF